MMLPSFDSLPGWAMALVLAMHLGAGTAIGVAYFDVLWRTTRRFAEGGSTAILALSAAGRFAVLAALLLLASLEGALPLLVAALGLPLGRSIVLRRARKATP